MPLSADSPPPTTLQSRTQASDQQGSSKTRAELLSDPYAAICTKDAARAFLDKNSSFAKDELLTAELLSHALLSIAHSMLGKTLQEGARSIVILMLEEAARNLGETMAQQVGERLKDVVEKVEEVAEMAMNLTEGAHAAVQGVARMMDKAQEQHQDPENTRTQTAGGVTYATALKGNVPLSHPNTLAWARARERQMLIDRDPRAEHDMLGSLTEQELVAKANEAVKQLESPGELEHGCFIRAKKLTNGGIVFELRTTDA